MTNYSYIHAADVQMIDNLYLEYKKDPQSIDPSWAMFFQGFDFASKSDAQKGSSSEVSSVQLQKELAVFLLILNYRKRGHLFANLNPLLPHSAAILKQNNALLPEGFIPIKDFGLTAEDLETSFEVGQEIGLAKAKLKDIIKQLQRMYCGTLAIEYYHVDETTEIQWWKEKIEKTNRNLTPPKQKRAFNKLLEAIELEKFLNKKFVGQKRFSIEGGESYIAALDAIVEKAGTLGITEMVMGMAHRGRINTLINVIQKPAQYVFSEFEGKLYDDMPNFDGDVKYHLGYSAAYTTTTGAKMQLTLCPNPSHLETVAPIVMGLTRSRIDHTLKDAKKIIPVLVHGDAALAGQGLVYEVAQMMTLPGYAIGGTIHIAINNQVGFTTHANDARSSEYCTDIAKTLNCPVLHIHADDVEAVVIAMEWAVEYRHTFGKDIYIDLMCYRKYGHNEGDEPRFTQPLMYAEIDARKYTKELYQDQLIENKVISTQEVQTTTDQYIAGLEIQFEASKKAEKIKIQNFLPDIWKAYTQAGVQEMVQTTQTTVKKDVLIDLGQKLITLPEGKKYFRKSVKILEDRAKMLENDNLDWGMAELLAYASLLTEGHPVRISGQDVERGTFSHRHAVIKTEDTEEKITPLQHVSNQQATFSIYNSLLSEYGVLGYEWGYAVGLPKGLTIWEAQFGDFDNGAQIIIDQYISTSEDKWNVMNGLVMLLPHGFEGQGSEHSSARLERFLQLCADANMQIANCTTPANFFHLLRRQVKRNFRKPLVVFTPKQLLRHPKAISSLADLASGHFQPLIDDTIDAKKIDTLVFCSGKLYYELLEKREKTAKNNIALIRLEQLYPLAQAEIQTVLHKYKGAKKIIWAQEEPENMGAWTYILVHLRKMMPNIEVVSRPASASPAPGSYQLDALLQKGVHDAIFG